MPNNFHAVIRQSGQWWIGWVEEIPGVNCQEATREELIASLRECLDEAITMNRQEAREALGDSYEEVALSL